MTENECYFVTINLSYMKFNQQLHEIVNDPAIESKLAALKNNAIDPSNPEISLQEQKANVLDLIMRFWKLIRLSLTLAKIFANDKADMIIDGVIEWGDKYKADENQA